MRGTSTAPPPGCWRPSLRASSALSRIYACGSIGVFAVRLDCDSSLWGPWCTACTTRVCCGRRRRIGCGRAKGGGSIWFPGRALACDPRMRSRGLDRLYSRGRCPRAARGCASYAAPPHPGGGTKPPRGASASCLMRSTSPPTSSIAPWRGWSRRIPATPSCASSASPGSSSTLRQGPVTGCVVSHITQLSQRISIAVDHCLELASVRLGVKHGMGDVPGKVCERIWRHYRPHAILDFTTGTRAFMYQRPRARGHAPRPHPRLHLRLRGGRGAQVDRGQEAVCHMRHLGVRRAGGRLPPPRGAPLPHDGNAASALVLRAPPVRRHPGGTPRGLGGDGARPHGAHRARVLGGAGELGGAEGGEGNRGQQGEGQHHFPVRSQRGSDARDPRSRLGRRQGEGAGIHLTCRLLHAAFRPDYMQAGPRGVRGGDAARPSHHR
mmetsp:Transcript_6538/g.15835  ORF Transcript_6538/g.15835 Transcript_6538/m.15835 type:complete len:437 (+) Transcript_6538:284-1594(+)